MPNRDGTGPINGRPGGRGLGRGFGLGICRYSCRNFNTGFRGTDVSEEEYLKRERQLLKEDLARIEARLGE